MSRIPVTKVRHSTLGLLLSLAVTAGAHVGDRVYPVAYLSDEMLEKIDLKDGLVDEWQELIGEPSMTLLDFTESLGMRELDPSNLDFRIWLAWHDDPPRFYLAFLASDDVYLNTYDFNGNDNDTFMFLHDSITLIIDGDHGGGPGCDDCVPEGGVERGPNQKYDAIARSSSGPTLDDGYSTVLNGEKSAWLVFPPYGDGGGGVFGENPTLSAIELYVTPFDRLVIDDIEGSVASDLTAGQVIGFAILVHDWDEDQDGTAWWVPEAMFPGSPPALIRILRVHADSIIDGFLLGPEPAGPGDSSVESVSWGRIKAALEVD